MPRSYLQLDVFAARAGTGNPLGVVFEAGEMDTATMQALAAWLNLSETIFFLPPDAGADYRIRIFTPGSELPFAGHPSVGAAWTAVVHGLATPRDGRLIQQCEAGLLPVEISGDNANPRVAVRSPRARLLQEHALMAGLDAITPPGQTAALWNNGPSWWMVEAASSALVRGLKPDFAAIAAWTNTTHSTGVAIFALEPDADHDVVVRAFCPGDAVNVPEDPVTGSANALVGALLHAQGRLPGHGSRYIASQGRELGRDGRVHVRVDADDEVWIGGQVQLVIDGQVTW